MKMDNFEEDKFEKIQNGFKKDGTHPDYPLRKTYQGEEFGKMAGPNPVFDLPALVVYERDEEGKIRQFGIIFALSHRVDGVCIHVMSKYKGEIICHPIEEPPSGKQPEYLLMKKHYTMIHVP